MKLYSTAGISPRVSLKEAVMNSLPADRGLYMPEHIPVLSDDFFNKLDDYSIQGIGYEVCKSLFQGYIAENDLKRIIDSAINFPAPTVSLDNHTSVLELFHGPSLAFKDFGARFMAQLMGYFNKGEDQKLTILVATSGDTGGAVAAGFHNVPGIEVVILYPSGKVSALQEKQLTTLGANIRAIEVNGSFDDCQDLVKEAFVDEELNRKMRLSSANSINIARLIPQSFYYFEAYKQVGGGGKDVVFSVPSGNYGNITAGVLASKMGLPVGKFIAASNANDIVPAYLKSGKYKAKPSVPTISNAMDVGNPSNFRRLDDIYCSTWNNFTAEMCGYSYSDEDTKVEMKRVYNEYSYIIDPHGAVASLAWSEYTQGRGGSNAYGIILETAHPSKFLPTVEGVLGVSVPIPESLQVLQNRVKEAYSMDVEYKAFKDYLLS